MNKIIFAFIAPILLAGCTYADNLTESTNITITKTWDQEPGGWTYPMSIHVPEDMPDGGYPVCILLHGNGGNGNGFLQNMRNVIQDHALVAPSGYQASWNICQEQSEAPDVEMVGELIELLQEFDNVNPNAIRIFGSSNGAALANRIYIENDNPGLDTVTASVTQLSDIQSRQEAFFRPSAGPDSQAPFCGYEESIDPINSRRYLNICNDNDNVIPYFGGFSQASRIVHLDARIAIFDIARDKGYDGEPILGDGEPLGDTGLSTYAYLDDTVVHLRGSAGHSIDENQREFLVDFLSTWPVENETCLGDIDESGRVDGVDLADLLGAWNTKDPRADFDGDGIVDGTDLTILLGHWGDC